MIGGKRAGGCYAVALGGTITGFRAGHMAADLDDIPADRTHGDDDAEHRRDDAEGGQAAGQALQGKPPMEVARFFAENLGYIDFVKQRGFPEAKARACVADKAALDTLSKNLQVADQKYQVNSKPTFILNGKALAGVDNWETLKPALAPAGI